MWLVETRNETCRKSAVNNKSPVEPQSVTCGGQYLTGIEGEPAASEQASWYIPLFAEEFGLYPPSLVHQTLARIVLCGELFRSQKPNPRVGNLARSRVKGSKPLYFSHRPSGGIPNGGNGDLYLSVTSGRDDKEHLRKVIHHEFYHCIQRRQFGRYGDLGWAALNRPDFVYGPGGLRVNEGTDRTFWVMPMEEWGSGFLNQYSMSAAEEDQAEILAHLLTEPARVASRLPADDILCSKVERLKATLEEFCPDVRQTDKNNLPRIAVFGYPSGMLNGFNTHRPMEGKEYAGESDSAVDCHHQGSGEAIDGNSAAGVSSAGHFGLLLRQSSTQ